MDAATVWLADIASTTTVLVAGLVVAVLASLVLRHWWPAVLMAAHGWWRWLVLALAVVAVLAVGGARIYRAAHHPSDVLGGALLGIGWLLVTTRAVSPGPLRPAGRAARQPTSTGTG